MHMNTVCLTLPLILHTVRGLGEMHLSCNGGKLFFIRCARLGMWPVCEVRGVCHVCEWCDGGVTCCQMEVAMHCVVLLLLCALSMGLKTKMASDFNAVSQ